MTNLRQNLIFLVILFLSGAVGANEVASGTLEADFSSWGKPALQGDWRISNVDDTFFLELEENFKAKKAPDIKIYLSKLPQGQISAKNADQDTVLIHLLTSFSGELKVAIPEGVDLSEYKSLVFHCLKYQKLWGTSSIK